MTSLAGSNAASPGIDPEAFTRLLSTVESMQRDLNNLRERQTEDNFSLDIEDTLNATQHTLQHIVTASQDMVGGIPN